MNLSSPMTSVIPGVHGVVLAVLARTDQPLSGREVAALTQGAASQRRVNDVLGALVDTGIVLRARHPPAYLYRLNRDHVAAEGIMALSRQRETLLERIRHHVAAWQIPPVSASLFGSAARGEAGPRSDVDIVLVSGLQGEREAAIWVGQIDQLAQRVFGWSGNRCEILELTEAEVVDAATDGGRLVRDLRADAIHLGGRDLRSILTTAQASA